MRPAVGPAVHPARFVARANRFVVEARLVIDGEVQPELVRAYLPNTARLTDVLVPDAELLLQPTEAPHRRTAWTVARVRDGAWVALAAGVASRLVVDHLRGGGALAGWPAVTAVRPEVTRDGHRFDLEVDLVDGTTGVVEVKSLSRARDGVAPLSATPSTRGVAHLTTLARLARAGTPTAAVFVVQRGDAEVLDLGAPADPAWVAAVRGARDAGVHVVAYRCRVGPTSLGLDAPLVVRDGTGP